MVVQEFSNGESISSGKLCGITITENTLHCNVLNNCFRVLVFQNSIDMLSVDFVSQKVTFDSLVVIGPKQFPFISQSYTVAFLCFQISLDILNDEDLILYYSLMFQRQKVLFPISANLVCYKLIKDLLESNHAINELYDLLRTEMRQRVNAQFGETIKINAHQFQVAKHFLNVLNRFLEFNIEHTCISKYINETIHNDKALLRMCNDVFKVSTRELLKYQLLLKTIQLLGNKKKSTISIANILGYSSISALTKFVKKQTNKTPIDIRNLILMVSEF